MKIEMNKVSPENSSSPEAGSSRVCVAPSPKGINPYATGGGGVTFERKVGAQFLAHLLVGDNVTELGNSRRVVSVAFQQAPSYSVDDLLISAARPDEFKPSLELALAVRRSLNLVKSNVPSQKLIQQFVRAVIDAPVDGSEHRLGLVVSGPQKHAEQLAELANLAANQMDASGFFNLVQTPGKFATTLPKRLNQLEKLVQIALDDLDVEEASASVVQRRTWQWLSRLTVSMRRFEPPDETDWSGVANNLTGVVPDSDLTAASLLRDRLVVLASEYSPSAARVDLTILRRDTHALLKPSLRRHEHCWQTLKSINRMACDSVSAEIAEVNGSRCVYIDRRNAVAELTEMVSDVDVLIVNGESGVGKSALVVLGFSSAAESDPQSLQTLCINLRQIPELAIEVESTLGCPLSTLLCELCAPQRILIVDGADAVAESRYDVFRYLVDAAQQSGMKVIAVTSTDSKQVVFDALSEYFGVGVAEYVVPPLCDSEIDEIVRTFSELKPLSTSPKSRELLRRLVVVDLLVRGQVSRTPLSDADAMSEVWSGLIRRREMSDRGFPDAREAALLQLAELELRGGERLGVISKIDPAALDGLRRDGLLRTSPEALFGIGPEFAHDEIRRYAVARLLLDGNNPASKLIKVGAPRWSLAAARLACQAWLEQPDTSTIPLKGRFAALQASFDTLGENHGSRWADVPGEALLTLANIEKTLQDAWSELLADDSHGLRRLARLVDQRLRDDKGVVDVTAVEPIVALLLKDPSPWKSGEHAIGLFRAWLRGHVIAQTTVGHPLRILLRQRLVEACAAGDRRLADERNVSAATHAKHNLQKVEHDRQEGQHTKLISRVGCRDQSNRWQLEVPREIKDEVVLELLALLGPDLGGDGEAILSRVAKYAPSSLSPAVDEFFASRAIASARLGLLAELTEAYYLNNKIDASRLRVFEDGIRRHRFQGLNEPLAAWHLGPFISLFQSDFRKGVQVLNRLLNHAARTRVQHLTHLDQGGQPFELNTVNLYENELEISGVRRLYVGDEHVWRWYRGTAVGPYPCFSALQALERACDQLIKDGISLKSLVPILMDGCESLAMIGLIVGILVRHLEDAEELLDPYLTEPLIWRYEFARIVSEAGGLSVNSEGLIAPERRNWSLREAAMFMVINAKGERIAKLRVIGENLVVNAHRFVQSELDHKSINKESVAEINEQQLVIQARAWASSLDRERYQAHQTEDGCFLENTPPDNVVKALQDSHQILELENESARLIVRYFIEPKKGVIQAGGNDELVDDLAIVQKLIESSSSQGAHYPWDSAALVAAAALEAHFAEDTHLPCDALSFAAKTVLRIGGGEVSLRFRQFEFEGTFYERGADRSVARVIPLLLLPSAAQIRAVIDEEDGSKSVDRAMNVGVNLARAVADEVRLYLARGLDHIWRTPCTERGCCHHVLGWQLAVETMRYCVLGNWDPETGGRSILGLKEPITESLANTPDNSIWVSRLDAAIRALAPAAIANICVSPLARDLLLVLLDAQQRSLLSYEDSDPDHRGTHTLVSARALLTLATCADEAAIYDYIDVYADNSALLGNLLRALSAAAEEAPDRAATARRIWPNIVHHVLQLNRLEHTPFAESYYGDMALASLIPNATSEFSYLYREVNGNQIIWWNPLELEPEVNDWLSTAAGNPMCVDQLIRFVRVLGLDQQVHKGLPWVAKLVEADPFRIARDTFLLPTWLIEIRLTAANVGLQTIWQQVVDDLVVAGVTQLALYSD